MKFQLFYEPEIVAINDDIADQIEDCEGEQYLGRVLTLITDEDNNKIGEMTGYILFTDEILSDLADSFFVMDDISQLLCNVHFYIDKNKRQFINKKRVLYLNRLSLYKEDRELEAQILAFLLDTYKTVIYSLGSTELTDNDFFNNQDDTYIQYWEKQLRKNGWSFVKKLGFYYKTLL